MSEFGEPKVVIPLAMSEWRLIQSALAMSARSWSHFSTLPLFDGSGEATVAALRAGQATAINDKLDRPLARCAAWLKLHKTAMDAHEVVIADDGVIRCSRCHVDAVATGPSLSWKVGVEWTDVPPSCKKPT